MKSLRGSFSFILGMIVGILLFVLSIGGALAAICMTVTVGKVQSSLTDAEIVDEDSSLYDSTILDAVLLLYDDIQNYDQLTMETIYDHFGIKYVKGVGGVDFSTKDFYKLKLGDVLEDISLVTNSFTLDDVGDLAGIDFAEYNIPMLTENSSMGISDLIDKIMSSFDGDLSIRFLKDNLIPDFDVDGASILSALQDINFDSFGSCINYLPLWKCLGLDVDKYVKAGINSVYVKSNRYEQISSTDLSNSSYQPIFGVKTYISGVDDTNNIIERELRYVQKTDDDGNITYKVDNSSYASDFDASTNETTYYRYIEYEKYSSTKTGDGDYYVLAYGNHVDTVSGTNYSLTPVGFVNLNSLYRSLDHAAIKADVVNGTINIGNTMYKDEENNFVSCSYYCMKDSPITIDSTLNEDSAKEVGASDYYIKAYAGETAAAIQSIAFSSIDSVSSNSFIDNMTLGDVLDIDSSSSVVMQSLKDKKISELSNAVDDLTIDQVIEIDDSSSQVLKSLKEKGTTVKQMSTAIDDLTIDQVIEIDDSSSKLMKSLKARGTKIKDLATIVDDLKINELLDVYTNYAVENCENTKATGFIVSQYKDETVDGQKVTYVYDENGKYILSPIKYTEATSAQLGTKDTSYYKYVQIKTYADAITYATNQNIYIYNSSSHTYVYNSVLSTYLIAQNIANDSGIVSSNLFFRDTASATSSDISYDYYSGSNLFVEIAGVKIQYDKTNPAHSDLTKYYLTTSDKYEFFVPIDTYRNTYVKNTGSTYTLGTDSDTALYIEGTTTTYSRQFIEDIYVVASNGTYVYYDGEYVTFDSTNEAHQSLKRFNKVEGFYATKEQSLNKSSELNIAGITITGVKYIYEKSAPILRTMANNDAKINDLSSVLNTSTIGDLMDVTPDSIFNNSTIKASTINGLSDSMTTVFNTMTIGELCDWANVTDIDENVKSTLKEVTMTKFFKSLKFDAAKGIYVDMTELFLN